MDELQIAQDRIKVAQEKINKIKSENPSATLLDLGRLGLTTKDLEQLIQDNNKLFSNITELYLDNNNLSSLPKEIGLLTKLETLYLNNNNLSSLPKEIGLLTKLETLYLDNNNLSSLPKEIGLLTKLRYLYLDNNNLSSLPKEIGDLSELETLYLNNNNFSNWPKEIGLLTKLRYLYLDNNNLSSLPKEIERLMSLQALELRFNPLDNDTMRFLRNMQDRNSSMNIRTNMSAHDKVSRWEGIFTDMPEYKDNATFIKVIESDTNLQRFISKARSSALYNTNKHEMTIGLDFLFEVLLNSEIKDYYINAMKGNACSTSVATYVIKCYLVSCAQQNKKPTTGFVERSAIYSFISKNAEKLKLRNNEMIEQAHGLLNALFLENSETYSNNQCKISRGDIINYRLPSITNYTDLAFEMVRPNTAKAFAELLCKTNARGELKKDDKGYYILDKNKYTQAISDNMPKFVNFVNRDMELDVLMSAFQLAQDKINKVKSQNPPGTSLDLSKCGLTIEVLQELIRKNPNFFSKLTYLDLSTNNLRTLPKEIGDLSELETLYLDHNNLRTLPKEIGDLSELIHLYLSYNKLSILPESIESLINLTFLYLLNNPLDGNTRRFLRNMQDRNSSINIRTNMLAHRTNMFAHRTNMSAHEKVSDWKDIFTDMPEYKDNATFIEVIESDFALQAFIAKARFPDLYRINKQEMIIGLDFLFKALLDPESEGQHRAGMQLNSDNCSTPAVTYVMECYIASCAQQNKEPTTGFVEKYAIYSFISKNTEKLKLSDNEMIEQAQGLLNALFLENSETYSKNKCKISRGDIINHRLPSTTHFLRLAFDKVRYETAKAFAELLCETNETGELKKDDKGYYILDENKYKKIISDNIPDFMQPEFINFVDGAMERLNRILETHQYDPGFGDSLNLFRDENLKENNGQSNLIRNAQLQPGQTLEKMESNLENYLTNLEKELESITLAKKLELITLAQNKIDKVQLQNTPGTTLNLTRCHLTSEVLEKLIQKNPDFFATLTHLYLQYNDLTSVPKEIEDLRNLKDFDVSYNPLDNDTLRLLSDMEKNNPNIKITKNTFNRTNVGKMLGTEFSGQSRQLSPDRRF